MTAAFTRAAHRLTHGMRAIISRPLGMLAAVKSRSCHSSWNEKPLQLDGWLGRRPGLTQGEVRMPRLACRTTMVEAPFLNLAEQPERSVAPLFIRCRHLEEARSQVVGSASVLREDVGVIAYGRRSTKALSSWSRTP